MGEDEMLDKKLSLLFKRIGAPFKNIRWSWGAMHEKSGLVIFRVWHDTSKKIDGKWFYELSNREWESQFDGDNAGLNERRKHLSHTLEKGKCFFVICTAEDPEASPRSIKVFTSSRIFVADKVRQIDGDYFVEMSGAIDVKDFRLRYS